MTVGRETNGHAHGETRLDQSADVAATEAQALAQKRPRPKKRGPNYAQIHSKPLPLEAHPLPAFHPSNPLSLLRLCYVFLSHMISPPSSHPQQRYTGYFSSETRSVHVTDPKHIRALWEMGFFGKGSLSRSEPSWLDREKARLQAEKGGRSGGTAEEATRARREERRLFKLERARLEREKIERQRMVEEGKLNPEALESIHDDVDVVAEAEEKAAKKIELLSRGIDDRLESSTSLLDVDRTSEERSNSNLLPRTPDVVVVDPLGAQVEHLPSQELPIPDEPEPDLTDQEHLQLSLEEAFYLSYALGVLDIMKPDTKGYSSNAGPTARPQDQLLLFGQHSCFPPKTPTSTTMSDLSASRRAALAPDNQFFLNYVVYHHFRSLGWVIRPGVKFSCDYLLYNRGPVFSHAEFAVLIMPSYTRPYWSTAEGRQQRRVKQKDWWWFHCINRVQSQVRKTLVLCYVDVPPPMDVAVSWDGSVDIGALLTGYTVRELLIKRWLANRSRD